MIDVLLQCQLGSEPHPAPGHNTFVWFGTAVRQDVPFQPASTARLLVVHLAAIPEASERSRLGVDVLDLQMVQQL